VPGSQACSAACPGIAIHLLSRRRRRPGGRRRRYERKAGSGNTVSRHSSTCPQHVLLKWCETMCECGVVIGVLARQHCWWRENVFRMCGEGLEAELCLGWMLNMVTHVRVFETETALAMHAV
jgi:hypothetical protein